MISALIQETLKFTLAIHTQPQVLRIYHRQAVQAADYAQLPMMLIRPTIRGNHQTRSIETQTTEASALFIIQTIVEFMQASMMMTMCKVSLRQSILDSRQLADNKKKVTFPRYHRQLIAKLKCLNSPRAIYRGLCHLMPAVIAIRPTKVHRDSHHRPNQPKDNLKT